MLENKKNIYDWGLFAYILLIPLTRQVPYHQVISYGTTVLLILAFFVKKLLWDSKVRFPILPVLIMVGFYLASIFLSLLWSDFLVEGSRQLFREIFFYLILFIIYDYVRGYTQWNILLQALVWCGGLAVLSVLAEGVYVLASGNALMGGDARLSGIFANPNVAGLLISVCFPVMIGFLQWKQAIHAKNANSFMYIVIGLTMITAVLTVSRGLLLGFFFSLLALNGEIFWKNRYKLLLVGLGVLFMAIVFGVSCIDSQMLASLSSSFRIDRGLAGRGFIWQRAWDIFLAHPILGTGPGTFLHYILSSAELRPYGTVEYIRYMYFQHGDMSLMHVPGIFSGVISNSAHNLWLDSLANTGLVGVMAVLLIFVGYGYFALQQMQIYRSRMNEPYYWVIRGCFVGLMAFFLRSQFEVSGMLRGALSESLPFWLTFLLVICSPGIVKKGTRSPVRRQHL